MSRYIQESSSDEELNVPANSSSKKLTVDNLKNELQKILPNLDPNSVTLANLMKMLQEIFMVEKKDLKPFRNDIIGSISDIISSKENERPEEHNDKIDGKKLEQNAIVPSSSSEEDEPNIYEGDSSEAEVEKKNVKKRRSPNKTKTAKKQKVASVKSRKKSTNSSKIERKDPPGLASLKEIGRICGIMGPAMYRKLKDMPLDKQEDVLRSKLNETGTIIKGKYPTKPEIAEAKRKKDLERELDGIDTSCIIDAPRRRQAIADIYLGKENKEMNNEEEEEEAVSTGDSSDEIVSSSEGEF